MVRLESSNPSQLEWVGTLWKRPLEANSRQSARIEPTQAAESHEDDVRDGSAE